MTFRIIHRAGLALLLPSLCLTVAPGCSGDDDDDASVDAYDTPEVDPSLSGNEFKVDGSWATRQVLSQYVEYVLPVGGPESGYEVQTITNYKMATITTDGKGGGTYSEKVCATDLTEVSGSTSTLSQGFYDNYPVASYTDAQISDEIGGAFKLPLHVVLLGVALSNPATDPLPTEDNYEDFDVSDSDGDGNPGFTVHVDGAIDADLWSVERYTFGFDGQIFSNDSISGLIQGQVEDAFIYSSSFLVPTDTDVYPDDVPEHNFFEMVRVEDGYDCTKLKANKDTLFAD